MARANVFHEDVVGPSRLFDIARQRLDLATGALDLGSPGFAPSALVVTRALQDLSGAIQALNAVLVPSSPMQQRIVAGEALFQVRAGEQLLGRYRTAVAPLPDIDLPRDRVPLPALQLLDAARQQITFAKQLLV